MRLRKEISKWSVKTFLKLAGILLVVFFGFYLITAWIDGALNDMNLQYILFFCVCYPALLASILTNGFRTGTLYVNDYQSIPDFQKKLKLKILHENMTIESETAEQTVYKPGKGFFSLFNAWKGSEKITATWGEEIVLSGSLRKVSALEDILTWNKDFKV